MRKYILLLIIIFAISHQTFAGKKLKVLFIGNSYTYVNNLPQITADVSASMGDTLLFDSYTVGGYSFYDHYYDPLCAQKIRSAKWDYVILQEQSLTPSEPNNSFFLSYYYATVLDTMIEANDSCSKVIFYMTWGYKNGFSPSCTSASWPYRCTYESMDSLTNLRYRAYADTATLAIVQGSPVITGGSGSQPMRSSLIAPVGAVRHYIRHNYPTIELYQPDESHPTDVGSYAAACTFYVTLFHKDPTLIPYNYVLNSTDAGNIKNAAKLVTYDSMSKWHIGAHDLRAQFTFSISGGNTLSLTNTSTSATNYTWDFGDGNTSALPNPTHIYTNGGVHTVRLVAFNTSCSDTTFAVINALPTGIGNVNYPDHDFIISPNPAKDILNIHSLKIPAGSCQLSIVNTLGQEVYFKKSISSDEQVDISGFDNGMYFILIKTGNNIVCKYKLLKL